MTRDDFLASERDRAELQDAADALEAVAQRAAGAGAELDRLVAEGRWPTETEPRTEAGQWLLSHQGLVNISKPAQHSMRGDEIDLHAAILTIEYEAADALRQAGTRLNEAIIQKAAVTGLGLGWKVELDADDEYLAALKAFRTALDGRPRP